MSCSKLIFCNVFGEFIGILIRWNSAVYSFLSMAIILFGFISCKMAIKSVFCKSVLNGMGIFFGVGG